MAEKRGTYLEDKFIKWVIAGVMILAIIWAGNIFYYKQHRLSQPMFMKHYYNFFYEDNIGFELYYLVNRDDNVQVVSIYFPALDYSIYPYPNIQFDWQSNDYYSINQFRIEMNGDDLLKFPGQEQVLLEEAVVTFSDGTEQKYNIGQILLKSAPRSPHLSWQASGGSSDGTAYTHFKANKPVNIIGLDNYFLEDFEDVIELKLNGKSLSEILFPISLEEGDTIRAEYAFSFDDREPDQRKYNYLFFSISLATENANGELGNNPFILANHPHIPLSDLKNLVRHGGEL